MYGIQSYNSDYILVAWWIECGVITVDLKLNSRLLLHIYMHVLAIEQYITILDLTFPTIPKIYSMSATVTPRWVHSFFSRTFFI